MTLTTRRPTGLPSWPLMLLAGIQGAGKSFAIAKASASPLIDRTLWVTLGELDPDEYGAIPGADFEIVEHDGTYDGVVQAFREIAAQPRPKGLPHLLAFDSATVLWDLIVDNLQQIANQRAKGRRTASGDYTISTDLWNIGKAQWKAAMTAIRSHRGPAIITARLDEVMVMEEGQPTKDKTWKVQAHKSLVFDVDLIVEMHSRGHALLTKVKSVRWQLEKPRELKGFTVMETWNALGLEEGADLDGRTFSDAVVDQADEASVVGRWRKRAEDQTTQEGLTQVWQDAQRAEVPTSALDAIRAVASEFKRRNQLPGAEEPARLPGTAASPPEQREWVKEAEGRETAAAVRELAREAEALGADAEVLVQLEAIAALKPGDEGNQANGEWARPEGAPDEWNTPAVLAGGGEKPDEPKPEPVKKGTKAAAAKPSPEPEPAAAEPPAEEEPF